MMELEDIANTLMPFCFAYLDNSMKASAQCGSYFRASCSISPKIVEQTSQMDDKGAMVADEGYQSPFGTLTDFLQADLLPCQGLEKLYCIAKGCCCPTFNI